MRQKQVFRTPSRTPNNLEKQKKKREFLQKNGNMCCTEQNECVIQQNLYVLFIYL